MSDTPSRPFTPCERAKLADQLETRGPVPECFAGVMIGITEVERDQIVAALRAQSETTHTTTDAYQQGWNEALERAALVCEDHVITEYAARSIRGLRVGR